MAGTYEAVDSADNFISDILSEELARRGLQFTPIDPASFGRRDSVHGVEFGQLSRVKNGELVGEFAVKSFVGLNGRSVHRANNERQNYIHANELGYRSFTPWDELSVIYSEENNIAFLISVYQKDLVPLHTIDWQINSGDEDFDNLIDLLNQVAEFTADLHASGVIHGDWQGKNVILDRNGNFWLADLEKSQVASKANDRSSILCSIRAQKQASKDIAMFFESILNYGFMPESNNRDKVFILMEQFAIPYINRLRELLDPDDRDEFAKNIVAGIINNIDEKLCSNKMNDHHGPAREKKASKAHWIDAELSASLY